MNKQERIAELVAEAERVRPLVCAPGVRVVFGEGNLDARLMLIGEAPGAEEDRVGRPFVGVSGRLLDEELSLAGLSRRHIYITSPVKCRPIVLRNGKIYNRAPRPSEIKAWQDLLMRQIEVIGPSAILCLGSISANLLIHPRFRLIEERGRWFDGVTGIRTMATFHPAYIHRWKRSLDNLEHQQFRADLKAAAEAVSSDEWSGAGAPPTT